MGQTEAASAAPAAGGLLFVDVLLTSGHQVRLFLSVDEVLVLGRGGNLDPGYGGHCCGVLAVVIAHCAAKIVRTKGLDI